ncbi:methyltransferase domain-containing protein [Acetobacter lambici]|uniref:Class I SAM-dependent methyltransferase n=1 Tax=Acetobacter lambici TaxID=1332824 RepID=A0ABT1EZI1_9PROT|nr:class I SAM-dependent methyltransferase [Acetobacter lambici]MCP1242636.1 class I SAM-dependent methyltransferase [Acetobacter lambici]MCP1258356.1 class I SAM-dependent methyltransferase [Acetobacter lambici]NHO57112.1 methyltransferase domain-containing protein [Acetobacter lambici]
MSVGLPPHAPAGPASGQNVLHSPTECPVCHAHRASFAFSKNGYDLFRCPDCDFLFVHPYPAAATITAFYEKAYRGASADFYPKSSSRRRRTLWKSLRFLRYIRHKDVLDLGCGGGFMVEAFDRLGARASGLDISQNSIAYARQHVPQSTFYCEDLTTFRQRNLTFDFVFSSEVLEHVPGPSEFMATLAAITRPNGYVYISAPDVGHPRVPKDLPSWADICPPEHLQFFNHHNLCQIFERYGFVMHKNMKNRTPAHSVLFRRKSN